jgi:hypothetical protein
VQSKNLSEVEKYVVTNEAFSMFRSAH